MPAGGAREHLAWTSININAITHDGHRLEASLRITVFSWTASHRSVSTATDRRGCRQPNRVMRAPTVRFFGIAVPMMMIITEYEEEEDKK
ncbi:hypothetical protein ElyMa_004119500 [Elysia marginata]|uniref:Uncharacterized protein n=1 Tax=Elysia marginata TaxID=1093978 RepID=A0AAV4GDQ5_9GAST|nr:hypothetical protein ElyMa_004119500 [Elysia marginata]